MQCPLAGLLAAIGLIGAAADDEPKGVTPYRVAVDGQMKITTDLGAAMTRRTQAEFDYRLARRKDGVDVALDRFILKVSANGQEVDFLDMSRSRLLSRRPDRPFDVRREDAPPAMLPLFDQFVPPLAEIRLDAEGAEVARKTKADGGPLVEAHVVDLTRLFHPRFPRDESRWEAPVVIPFGRGQTAAGALRYAKRPGESKGGLVAVDVTGFLKVSGDHDGAEIKRGAYKVAGRQTFDPASNDWVAGKLTVAAGFEAVMPNGAVVRGEGPVTLTLGRREAPAKAKGKKKGA